MRAFFEKNVLFTASLLLFALHYVLQIWLKISIPWADNYLDPVLMMPIVLTLYASEKVLLQKPNIGVNLSEIVKITLIIAFVAEYIFPKINSACFGDIWDVLGYCSGSFLYVFVNYLMIIISNKLNQHGYSSLTAP